MEYFTITKDKAEEIKLNIGIKKERFIDFNFSTAYFLKDDSVVVQPLNPFGKCLRILDLNIYEKFIKQESFPIVESLDNLYKNNSDIIVNIARNKENLINVLYKFVYKKDRNDTLDLNKIEDILLILKKKKMFENYKLNFIVLLTDFILQSNKNYKWGILKVKQLMNPIYRIVLVVDDGNERYYQIEQEINDRLLNWGVEYIISRAVSRSKKSGELEKIIQVINFNEQIA